jgi:hypothetical protein
MAKSASAFFAGLAERGRDPVLGSTRGTVRIDVVDGAAVETWRVTMDRGRITVAEGAGDAQCTVRASRTAFEAIANGMTGALAATLRGALQVEGDPRLLVRFQRLFPAPTAMPAGASARSVGKRRS